MKLEKIMRKYPNRVPCVVDGIKYLAPRDMRLCDFLVFVRRRMKYDSHEAIFVTFGGEHYPMHYTMHEIYQDNVASDGFLYGIIHQEKVYGHI